MHLGGEVEVMLWRIITGCNYEARVNEGKSGIKIEENASLAFLLDLMMLCGSPQYEEHAGQLGENFRQSPPTSQDKDRNTKYVTTKNKLKTKNHKHKTMNMKPQTKNHKQETTNKKPQTKNHKQNTTNTRPSIKRNNKWIAG